MFYFLIFILGIAVGSFLNVVIIRLNNGEKIVRSRSHCPHCGHNLSARDLIPLISFLILRGKCRYCQKQISWQYFLMELTTGILFVLATYNILGAVEPLVLLFNFNFFVLWLRDLVFISFLIIIFVYDLRWYLILDKITGPAMIVALLFNFYLGVPWTYLLLAALAGFGFFALQYLISAGRWIGGGDLRLGLLMGLMLSWPNIIVALFLAYIIGAVFSLGLVAIKKKEFKSQIPFGTFLSLATIITLLWGSDIINWYLNFL